LAEETNGRDKKTGPQFKKGNHLWAKRDLELITTSGGKVVLLKS